MFKVWWKFKYRNILLKGGQKTHMVMFLKRTLKPECKKKNLCMCRQCTKEKSKGFPVCSQCALRFVYSQGLTTVARCCHLHHNPDCSCLQAASPLASGSRKHYSLLLQVIWLFMEMDSYILCADMSGFLPCVWGLHNSSAFLLSLFPTAVTHYQRLGNLGW